MADITSESQILKIDSVKEATNYLRIAVRNLGTAIDNLNAGLEFCNDDVIIVGNESPFTKKVEDLIKYITIKKETIEEKIDKIEDTAENIIKKENASLKKYQEKQALIQSNKEKELAKNNQEKQVQTPTESRTEK